MIRALVRITMGIPFVLLLIGCQAPAKQTEPTEPTEKVANITTCTPAQSSLRFASFNVLMFRKNHGELNQNLSDGSDPQIAAVAEIIQRTRPDVLLLNEFDYDPTGTSVAHFQNNYLAVGHNTAPPINYPFVYQAPSNTGVASGVDLNGDGALGLPEDAQGYGLFPGQYGMVLLSRYPIDKNGIRNFQNFLWQDMPGNLLPTDYYSEAAQQVLRLSSKSHWDIPINIGGERIHVLAAHPTPPVFDGPEDRNGRRNHDEIRMWADYISAGQAQYLYDNAGQQGGLPDGARFVIMGDYNADPQDGDSTNHAIRQLLDHPAVNSQQPPASLGGVMDTQQEGKANLTHGTPPAQDTADMNPNRNGNLRIDYALPSKAGLELVCSGVFWPAPDDPLRYLVGEGYPVVSSDHRMVWVDVTIR